MGASLELNVHGDCGESNTAKHWFRPEERRNGNELQLHHRHSRAICQMREVLSRSTLFEERLRLNLHVFKLNELVVLRESTKAGQRLASLGAVSVVFQPSWGEGHEDHAYTEGEGRNQLQAERYKPRSIFLSTQCCTTDVVGPVVDPETDQDASGDSKLLKSDESTTDFWGSLCKQVRDHPHHYAKGCTYTFGVVHRYDHGQ